ncbi:MAG: Hsp20/alpha crystallin family protein [Deltaproteobacteria bacterium]|jgi:HSP20 family molecular chaperone IbpA|nr:Hsp20/alpha crystallin family protein [Deltaproteobacteria bacterium]MBW2534545.1 Hsp20/alpha crystallin family protein [Deltaproteobacteria bacterium]
MTTAKDLVKTDSSDKPQRLTELPTIAPPVDIYENDEEILLVADLPGVTPDDIDVHLEQGQLDLEGKQVPPTEQAESLPPVMFARSFRVPETVDANGVVAELRGGVLHIHLKKSEAARPKRIKVTAG